MVSTDDAADAALAAAMGDAPPVTVGEAATATEGPTSTLAPGPDIGDESLPSQTPPGGDAREVVKAAEVDTPATCTADEAHAMVDTMRAALDQLDTSLTQIMETHAWKALGYTTPSEFVLAELGPDPTGDATGRVSKRHAYRLARLAMFLYGLAERIGSQDGYPFELSERLLRSIPTGVNGANDQVLLDRVQARLDAMSDPTEQDIQTVLDEEIARARTEIDTTGKLSDAPTGDTFEAERPGAPMFTGDGFDTDDGFTDDTHPEPGERRNSDSDSAGNERDNNSDSDDSDDWAGAGQGGINREDMLDSMGTDAATDESLTAATALREMLAVFTRMPAFHEFLPDVLDYASVTEIDDLIEQAAAAEQIIADVRKHAQNLA